MIEHKINLLSRTAICCKINNYSAYSSLMFPFYGKKSSLVICNKIPVPFHWSEFQQISQNDCCCCCEQSLHFQRLPIKDLLFKKNENSKFWSVNVWSINYQKERQNKYILIIQWTYWEKGLKIKRKIPPTRNDQFHKLYWVYCGGTYHEVLKYHITLQNIWIDTVRNSETNTKYNSIMFFYSK